jgi:hypothetical protein
VRHMPMVVRRRVLVRSVRPTSLLLQLLLGVVRVRAAVCVALRLLLLRPGMAGLA